MVDSVVGMEDAALGTEDPVGMEQAVVVSELDSVVLAVAVS